MLRELMASGWGEEIMAIEPSAMRGWIATGARRRGARADVAGMCIEWDECGMARMGGVALICIEGPLSRVSSWWGGMGYDQILEAHDRANRSDARAVLQVGHTPGGYISGMDECAQAIEAMFKESGKPLHAISNDMLYSAGYRLALPASKIWTTRAGGVGSVGIKVTREDWTAFNELAGIKKNQVVSGSQKNDGDPDVPYTKEEAARINGRVQHHFGLFADATMRSRGLVLNEGEWAQAALYLGENAVKARMADGIKTIAQCVTDLETMTSGRPMVAVPAGPVGQQSQTQPKAKSMDNAMLALALELGANASDQEITTACARLVKLEKRMKVETGKTTEDEIAARIDAWRTSHAQLEATNATLEELRAKEDARQYEALFAKGEMETKITPANAANVRAKHKTASALATFLETALPGVPGRENASIKPAHTGERAGGDKSEEKGEALTYKGKTWAELKPMEQAELYQADRDLWQNMRNGAQKGGA